ncbi:MAG TPA: kelch repeat-containing protein [Vulgatibacter sp.]|nr:kelch repeat-containing protein [Vulgatibacter sp.]
MRSSKMIRGAACAASLLIAACGESDSRFDLVLVHEDCETATGESVLPVSGTVRISIVGDGIGAPIVGTADVASRSLQVPDVPVGSNRVATVEVCDDGATCNVVRAWGRSAPFDVSDSDTPTVEVQMFRVNGFTRTRAPGGACSDMGTVRAGHTATRLQDGRVLLAGGFRLLVSDLANDVLQSAEIFDPATGVFSAVPDMCVDGTCLPRAFGQAVRLLDGRVLIAGGVDETGEPTASAILFDPKANAWTAAPSMAHARHGHTATLLEAAGGRVVIVGGVDAEGVVREEIEVFDRGAFSVLQGGAGGLLLPRAFHSAAVVGTTPRAVQVVGGIGADGKVQASSRVVSYSRDSGTFTTGPTTSDVLEVGVASAGIAPFSKRLAVVAGASKWSLEGPTPGLGTGREPIREIQWFDRPEGSGDRGTVPGQMARISPCVVMLGEDDARTPDDRALVIGGFAANGITPLTKAEVIGWRGEVLASSLTDNQGRLRDDGGRGYATCTNLGDGRILVSGGIGSGNKAVPTAEIYVARGAD